MLDRVGSKLNLQVGRRKKRSVVPPTSLNVIITRSGATVEKRRQARNWTEEQESRSRALKMVSWME